MDPRLAGRPPRQPSAAGDDQQMQSAKFSLLSALLKPEPKVTKLTPNIINEFHPLLLSVAKGGQPDSPEFVKCVARLVTYIASSRKRTHAIGQHLTKMADSFHDHSEHEGVCAALNFLHLIAAVFACSITTSNHATPEQNIPAAVFTSGISAHAVSLICTAAPRHGLEAAPVHRQIHALHVKWQKMHIFTKSLRMKLRTASRTAYDDWLSWLLAHNPHQYESIKHLSTGSHSHTTLPEEAAGESWYNAPVSAMIPNIKGQRHIKASAMDTTVTMPTPLDPELQTVLSRHISEVARIFAGPNVAQFSVEDNIALNGLGQPISSNPSSGKRKRLGPVYYGVSERCAKSFKKAREELPVFAPIADPPSHNAQLSRNVPPPLDNDSYGFSAPYPQSQPPIGSSRGNHQPYGGMRDGGSGNWRGGGNSWSGDRGRGFGGRGNGGGSFGGGGGRGRGRGGWNGRN